MTLLIGLCLLFQASMHPSPATAPAIPTDLYYVVFLRPNPARTRLAPEDSQRIQAAHMANIGAMAATGVLVAAGPFDDTPPTISGIFIFKVASLAEATRIAALDPTVVEHRNTVDVVPWRGPRGVGEEHRRLHGQNPDMPQGMGVQPLFLMYRGSAKGDADSALRAHSNYVERLRADGKIAAAGLTEGGRDLLSIVVFSRIGFEDAARLVAEDPAVKNGALKAESHKWWCAEHVLPG